MLKTRLHAASEVQHALLSAEAAADAALQEVTVLLNTMCVQRAAASLPLATASSEFDHITQAVSLLGQGRSKILAAHKAFVDTRAELLPTIAWGDVGDCPSASVALAPPSAAPMLKAVG